MNAPPMILVLVLTLGLGLALATAAGQTPLPESFTRLWNDPALLQRIQRDTERHRKGDATLELVTADGRPVPGATLEIRQQAHEFQFGCNLFVLGQLATPELNRKYEAAFARLFNSATLPFYWGDLEPEAGKPRFAEGSPPVWRRPPPDVPLKWCQAQRITPKGHALLYVKNMFMPDWTARDRPDAFRAQAAEHLAGLASRYGASIPVWDAVNEELPRRVHPGEWHAVPDDFLLWAFREAGRRFPPGVRLLINDGQFQAHYLTGDYQALARELLAGGAPLGGIGMQFHISRDPVLKGNLYPPGRLCEVYDSLGSLGLPLSITEITVPAAGPNGPELQAAIVENYYRLWFSTPMMAGITWWNLGDGTAYQNENKALGGLLDEQMNPKPAYQALERLIHQEWRTRLSLKTGANGRASFRGFLGEYEVAVESGGRSVRQPFRLAKGSAAHWQVRL